MSILTGKKNIHFVGIGGSGMYPIVQILASRGYNISGSDVLEGDIINYERNMGIKINIPHDPKAVEGADLVVIPLQFSKIIGKLPMQKSLVFHVWKEALCWGR